MSSLLSLTLLELTQALKNRAASPVDLMREVFACVDEHNPRLNAIVVERSRDALLAEARAAEARIADGAARPLEGIPLGVKDLEDAAGLPTSQGSKLFHGVVAEEDSVQVARLKRAGAIVYGKTNVPEFGGAALTKNLVFGVTRSPWSPERSPGGSSGGSAAALSAEMLPLVTASDAGGSIRIPSSLVGAFGMKPSFGRVPTGPLRQWQHATTVAYGPLSKTVEDGAFVLDLVAGYHGRDPMSLPPPSSSFLEAARTPLERKLRIGFSPDLGYAIVESGVASVVEDAVRTFERLGHTVVPVRGGPPEMNGEWGILSAFEIGARLAPLRPERDAEVGRAMLDTINYVSSLTQQIWGSMTAKRAEIGEWCAKTFDDVDVLVTPTIPFEPPPAKGPYPTETDGRQQITAAVASFTIPFNLSWNPAASVRAGLSSAGLPIGMQIVAPHHREDLVFQVARTFERERPAHPNWPLRAL